MKDVDLSRCEITARDGKGQKDRITLLPRSVRGLLEAHLKRIRGSTRTTSRRDWEASSLRTHLLADGYDFRTSQELLGSSEVSTTMVYTRVLNRGGRGVRTPLD